eukprot:5703847-Pleurochrysis_carterae.AAC.2
MSGLPTATTKCEPAIKAMPRASRCGAGDDGREERPRSKGTSHALAKQRRHRRKWKRGERRGSAEAAEGECEHAPCRSDTIAWASVGVARRKSRRRGGTHSAGWRTHTSAAV